MRRTCFILSGFICLLIFSSAALSQTAAVPPQAAADLLGAPEGWTPSEDPQKFLPETLFEYIDGAAENFLSYDFSELALGRFKGNSGETEMTVEIYDMGLSENAFGIYASERYPESRFLKVGVQGYIEEGVLNFFAGRFYVKLLAYPAGEKTEADLKSFASGILGRIPDAGDFPLPVRVFPQDGLVANSEKFILRDFLGLKFLTRGYVASYRPADAGEFDAFVIEAKTEEDARGMLEAMIGHFSGDRQTAVRSDSGISLKDPYLMNIRIVPSGRYLCGVIKLKDSERALGDKIAIALAGSLAAK